MEIMSERNEVTRKIKEIKEIKEFREIREELKNFKTFNSNRKATIKLLSLVSDKYIFMGKLHITCEGWRVHTNNKFTEGLCWICCNRYATTKNMNVHSNSIRFDLCSHCRDKNLCTTCLRETSRCSIIHTRKLLCYKFLLSQKFPKDVIRLIVKKVK